jgi:N-acetylglucosamine-6-phosphate deacetylase
MALQALRGAAIFDGDRLHENCAVLLEDGVVAGIVAAADIPSHASIETLAGGTIVPGFVDLQVNGGGGVMLNDAPDVATIARIAAAHRRSGTAAFLPTLITADTETTRAAIDAAAEAVRTVPGVIGLHLEGPHLAPARKGAHRADLMRAMTERDADALIAARARVGVLMVTVAVEQAAPKLIRRLADAGVIVSLGHSDATYDAARAAFDAGARAATHLFNAMSQLGNRDPGLVGAALASGHVYCGVIADGHHVHAESLRIALAAKRGRGRLFCVTDAMAVFGTDAQSFLLDGREVRRAGGRLTLADGTLAGADVEMAESARFLMLGLGLDATEALRMTSCIAAELIGDARLGHIGRGTMQPLAYLDREGRPPVLYQEHWL